MCLFNRQIEFMASFSTTRLPLRFQGKEYDPSIFTVGAWSPLGLSLSLAHCRSLLLPPYSIGPSSYPFPRYMLTRLASSCILFTPPLLLSSPLLSSPLLSSHLVSSPLFQSFRSSFKPGPRGQEFGLVFQTSLLALLW